MTRKRRRKRENMNKRTFGSWIEVRIKILEGGGLREIVGGKLTELHPHRGRE